SATFNTSVSFLQLVEPRFVQGFGIAFFFTPLISVVISGLPPERIASALGLANFFRILGGSFGTSLSVTVWDNREAFHHSQLTEYITNFNPESVESVKQLQTLGFHGLSSYEQLVRVITNQAYMLSTNDCFWLSGWIFLSLLIFTWLTKPPFVTSGETVVGE
ncbi:MAG: MFS transporter, partial [Gammaproteobacteria bacterium]